MPIVGATGSGEHEQTLGVLLHPAVAHLGEPEHPLDDPDGVLDLRPHPRLHAVLGPLGLIDDAPTPRAAVGEILLPPARASE
jgi:hypothetical protein